MTYSSYRKIWPGSIFRSMRLLQSRKMIVMRSSAAVMNSLILPILLQKLKVLHVILQMKRVKRVILRKLRNLVRDNSSSQRAVGSALNVKIITLRAEKSAIDARNLRQSRTRPESQFIWRLMRKSHHSNFKRRGKQWRSRVLRLTPNNLNLLIRHQQKLLANHLSNLIKRLFRHPLRSQRELTKERVIGFVNDATTTTSHSDRIATCAIFHMSWATKWLWCLTNKVL